MDSCIVRINDIILFEKHKANYETIMDWFQFRFDHNFKPPINLRNWLKYGYNSQKASYASYEVSSEVSSYT